MNNDQKADKVQVYVKDFMDKLVNDKNLNHLDIVATIFTLHACVMHKHAQIMGVENAIGVNQMAMKHFESVLKEKYK